MAYIVNHHSNGRSTPHGLANDYIKELEVEAVLYVGRDRRAGVHPNLIIRDCRANLIKQFSEYLGIAETDDLYRAAFYALSQNLVHGGAMNMLTWDGSPK